MPVHQWKDLDPIQLVALKGYGGEPGIFIRASMLRALKGDGSAAIVLAQLIYWSQSDSAKKNEGWFYLTTQAMTRHVGMSKDKQRRVRDLLTEKGILEFERRGMPAKNWYRLNLDGIVNLLAEQFDDVTDEGDIPPTSGGETLPQGDGKDSPSGSETPPQGVVKPHSIVRTKKEQPVRTQSKLLAPASGPKRDPAVVSVCGNRFDAGITFIMENYPLSGQGFPVTDHQARRALKKMGDVLAKDAGNKELWDAAMARVREFMQAVKNIKAAVDAGETEMRFVPGFEKFAGIKIMYGEEPSYLRWASKVTVEKKKTLVV